MGNTKKWTMRDGTKIRIRDMDDTHLANTFKMLVRVAHAKHAYDDYSFWSLPEPQCEMALMDYENMEREQADKSWEDFVPDIFWDIQSEMELRGLFTPKHGFSNPKHDDYVDVFNE